jgi:maleate isomerase
VINKFGILVPSANIILEPDMYRMIPQGVSVHFARVRTKDDTREEIEGMIREVEKPSELLKDAHVNVIAFGCTAGSFIGGSDYDQEIILKVEAKTGIPATTTSTAAVSALKKMGIDKITIATPYEEWMNDLEAKFFESKGISVLSIKGKGMIKADEQASLPPAEIMRFVKEIHDARSNGVFISCTNFRGVEAIQKLERSLRKPVIASNQATLWMLMHMTNVKKPIRGFGKLLSMT